MAYHVKSYQCVESKKWLATSFFYYIKGVMILLFNLYSALPVPMTKKILANTLLADKLTTIVMYPFEFQYVHIYERINNSYIYQKTIRL